MRSAGRDAFCGVMRAARAETRDSANGFGMLPRLALDAHSEARQFRRGDAARFRHQRILQHVRPVGFVEPLAALLDPQVGHRGRQVSRGVEQQRPAGGVRREGQLMRVGERGNLARFGEPAAPAHVEHDELRGPRFEHRFELQLARHAFAEGQCEARGPRQFRVLAVVARHQHVLEPHRLVGFQRLRDANGRCQVPHRVELHQDLDRHAEAIAQNAHRPQRGVDLRRRDELPLVGQRRAVEGPDFDGADAVAVDQFLHDAVRLFVEVVALREARVVEPHSRVRPAADQAVDRRLEHVAEQVPQR